MSPESLARSHGAITQIIFESVARHMLCTHSIFHAKDKWSNQQNARITIAEVTILGPRMQRAKTKINYLATAFVRSIDDAVYSNDHRVANNYDCENRIQFA